MDNFIKMVSLYGKASKKNIDINKCIKRLSELGYSVDDSFLKFIKKYGGVYGYHSAYKNKKTAGRTFYIDPEEAVQHIIKEWVEGYEERAECKLTPIGECCNGYFILMYGNGVLYGGADDYLYKYGNNISEAIDNFVNGKELIEIN